MGRGSGWVTAGGGIIVCGVIGIFYREFYHDSFSSKGIHYMNIFKEIFVQCLPADSCDFLGHFRTF